MQGRKGDEGVWHQKGRKVDDEWQGGNAETDFISPAKSVVAGNGKVKSCTLQAGGLPWHEVWPL